MFLDKILLRLRWQTCENLGESRTQENETQTIKEVDQSSL